MRCAGTIDSSVRSCDGGWPIARLPRPPSGAHNVADLACGPGGLEQALQRGTVREQRAPSLATGSRSLPAVLPAIATPADQATCLLQLSASADLHAGACRALRTAPAALRPRRRPCAARAPPSAHKPCSRRKRRHSPRCPLLLPSFRLPRRVWSPRPVSTAACTSSPPSDDARGQAPSDVPCRSPPPHGVPAAYRLAHGAAAASHACVARPCTQTAKELAGGVVGVKGVSVLVGDQEPGSVVQKKRRGSDRASRAACAATGWDAIFDGVLARLQSLTVASLTLTACGQTVGGEVGAARALSFPGRR